VALWRAQHVQIDPEPHVLEDEIGLRLIAPTSGWRNRPDMKGRAAERYRAGVVIRARFVEDLLTEEIERGVTQYVILGAGLDTFAQRKPELASRLKIFEVDRPGPQAWKRERQIQLGYGIPRWLHLVPVDFESGESWLDQTVAAGFDPARPAFVSCTGVSMYLTREAIVTTLRHAASLAARSTLAMTFLLPAEARKRASTAGGMRPQPVRSTRKPFISFFRPQEMLALARKVGFQEVQHLSGIALTERFLPHRSGRLSPSCAEEMLVAVT
jgi:methyltransferase (TIGR00027 family)